MTCNLAAIVHVTDGTLEARVFRVISANRRSAAYGRGCSRHSRRCRGLISSMRKHYTERSRVGQSASPSNSHGYDAGVSRMNDHSAALKNYFPDTRAFSEIPRHENAPGPSGVSNFESHRESENSARSPSCCENSAIFYAGKL